MSPRGLKGSLLVTGIALSGLTLVSWSQTWFVVTLGSAASAQHVLEVRGDVAAPALAAFCLAGLALIGALAIAGLLLRVVLGVLESLIGLCVVFSGAVAVLDPLAASAPLVTKATGVSGGDSISGLVTALSQSAWPWAAIVLGLLTAVLGVVITVTARRWPPASRRYQPARFEPDGVANTPVSDWDSLSGGSDPTSG